MATSAEIDAIVRQQIGDRWDETNLHGVDLRRCLVPARLEECVAGWDQKTTLNIWIVLEEHPGAKEGYMIGYDPDEGGFGLITSGVLAPCFLGYYGDFLETLASM